MHSSRVPSHQSPIIATENFEFRRTERILAALIILSTLFWASCNHSDDLSRICPQTCYSGPAGTLGTGQCRAGVPTCDENFNIIACDGEVLPEIEQCDGVDNDCDGRVDGMTQYSSAHAVPENYPCLVHGECSNSSATCQDGEWICAYGPTVEAGEETRCDNLDNDCDGRIDEDLFEGQFCYTGEIGTELTAPCHPGSLACVDGEVVCFNQVVPTQEKCDQIDNNCNGVVDDLSDDDIVFYDIVIGVDTSASMLSEISAVLGALGEYVEQFSGEEVRFAIVDMSRGDYPYMVVDTDFANLATIHERLMYLGPSGRGEEASLDAPFEVCNSRGQGALPLSWRENAQGIYLGFTDEAPQTYADPPHSSTEVAEMCLEHNVTVYHWSFHGSEFDHLCSTTGGKNFRLSSNHEDILSNLNEVLLSLCTE